MEKARVIVLTDIGPWDAEPDDAQSLVRLLLYANEYDIEGIIPNASWCGPDTSAPGYMQRILDVIDAYEKVYDNLCVHAAGYPTADMLRSRVKRGTNYVNMRRIAKPDEKTANDVAARRAYYSDESNWGAPNVGAGCSNEGSRLIAACLTNSDQRPLWICCWGGVGTLAQALYDLSQQKDEEQMRTLVKKLRVYDIDGQDDCGAWICNTFPDIRWQRSDVSFWGFSETPQRNKEMFGPNYCVFDLSTTTPQWLDAHIQSHGPLGELYPLALYGMETDSPSFLNLVRNGLSDPEHVHWGGWGGRHTLIKSQNPPAEHFNGTFLYEKKPFYMHRDDVDTVFDEKNGRLVNKDICAPIARWRTDYQHDMAVRMDWSVSNEYSACNHNPIAVVDGDSTKDAIVIQTAPGCDISPDASASYDPDGDSLTFKWYVYPEPGTYFRPVAIDRADTATPVIHVPKDAHHDEIHVILEVQDNGRGFALKAYRRLVLRTGDTGLCGAQEVINDTAFTYSEGWHYLTDQYGSHEFDTHVSDSAGATAELTFMGNRVMLFGGAYQTNGIAEICIDNGRPVRVDFSSQLAAWKNRHEANPCVTTGDTLQYLSEYLEDGPHTLRITVTGEKSRFSEGYHIVIDRAVVFGK